MVNYFEVQTKQVNNLSKNNFEYIIDVFRNEEDLISILKEMGYSKSFIADTIIKGYKILAKNKLYGF